ncbi:vWA domain-containing protein [Amycolatopsis azurea]|uniref:VWFA domain-containing protein n=1 Tax=Amycolatopsis azurea DSM 43854 TaxID=1238180 RepID=M2QKU3_9PSEU|nr:VWA domain-containing protein [Amycolatopsis azurea]EMD26472.1 hypothetical protein C791_3316 [Amycolatopsis azurea DSM 43854]OOC05611.1 hypothetical protein B0293_14680 [Amycolatopsis azurea DSM 43854]
MARTRWWRVGLAVVLAVALVAWLADWGLLDWMLAAEHPVRNVLEAMSWPAGVLALVWAVAPTVLKRTRPEEDEHPGSPTGGLPPVTTMSSHRGSGTTVQAGRDIRGRTVVNTVPPPRDEPGIPAHPPSDDTHPSSTAEPPTMGSHTGSGTTIQAARDIRGGVRVGVFRSIPLPRSVRVAIIITVVVALVGGVVTAVVKWVLPEFDPTYKTEFLIDLSAADADPSVVAESRDSLLKAIGNTGDDDAVALRTFGGQCGTDGNTSQLVTFGTGNRDDLGKAIGGAPVTGAATLVRGLIEAAEDFSGPFSRDAKQVNRIVVVTRNGVDACDDDAGYVQREIRNRLASSGLAVEFRFVGYRLGDKDKSSLDRLASSASAAPPVLTRDPAELQAALDWIANVEPVLRSAQDVVGILNPVAKQLNDAAQAAVDGRLDVADRTLAAIKPVSADAEFENLKSRAKTPDAVEVSDRTVALRDRQKNAVPAVTALVDLAKAGKSFTAELTAFRHDADLYNSEVSALNTLLAKMRAAGPGGHR